MTKIALRAYLALIFFPPLLALLAAFGAHLFSAKGLDFFFVKSLLNTLFLAFASSFLCLLISFPLALLLAKVPLPGAKLGAVILTAPLLFLPYQTALAWSFILPEPLLGLLFSPVGVVFVFTLSFFPLLFWPLYLAFLSIPAEAEESALLLYPPGKVLWKITLPYVKPYLLGGLGLCLFFCFAEIGVPVYLGVPVIGSEILTRFAAFYDIAGALRSSLPLALLGLLFFLAERPFLSRWEFPVRWETTRGLKFSSPYLLILTVSFLVFILFLAVFFPLFLLFHKALSADWQKVLLQVRGPLWRSLLYGLVASLGSVFLIFWAQPFLASREKGLWEALGLLVFFLPPVALAVGLIFFWGHFPLVYASPLLLLLGLWGRFTFLPQRLLAEAWRRFDKKCLEAAYLTGRPFFTILLKIVFPPFRPWIGLAIVLFFIFAVNEMALSSLLYPPGGAPLAVAIYTLSVNTPLSFAAALCLLNTLMILLTISVLFFFFRPRSYERRNSRHP